jgi:spermidine/putrescine transport system permease protein
VSAPASAPPVRASESVAQAAGSAPRRRSRWGERLLFLYTWLIIAWLVAPIGVMVLFSFNNTPGRYNTTWRGFTLKWYGRVFEIQDLTRGLRNSLVIAGLCVLISGVLGTFLGLAIGKYRFRGQAATNLLMFAAISAPEIVLGASLLSLFISMGIGLGFFTILIAHVMFSLSFVAVVVRARVLTLDPYIEEAARDLGAGPWSTFWRITLPMIFPAVLSGGLLAFALSIDDFIITNFTAGPATTTFPLWIWGATRVGIPPQVNVMGTLIFMFGVSLAVVNVVMSGRRAAR